jgi:hypothetical protein
MLPKTLKYGSKIESAYARSMRSNIQPQNGTGNYNLAYSFDGINWTGIHNNLLINAAVF